MTNEKVLHQKLKALERFGAFVYRVENSVTAGLPDIVVMYNGKMGGIELKTVQPNNTICVRASQMAFMHKQIQAGIQPVILAINSVETVFVFKPTKRMIVHAQRRNEHTIFHLKDTVSMHSHVTIDLIKECLNVR